MLRVYIQQTTTKQLKIRLYTNKVNRNLINVKFC